MIGCSGMNIDSNPRASHLRATVAGSGVSSLVNAKTPIFITPRIADLSAAAAVDSYPAERRSPGAGDQLEHTMHSSASLPSSAAALSASVWYVGSSVRSVRLSPSPAPECFHE